MKKVFTSIAAMSMLLGSFSASAATPVVTGKNLQTQVANPRMGHSSASRALTCDTTTNVLATDNSVGVYTWSPPGVGYFCGNGALTDGTTFFILEGTAEKFATPAGASPTISATAVFFGKAVINATDSATPVHVYVTDANGSFGGPGARLDSATVTLKNIARAVTANAPVLLPFSTNPTLPTGGYFIVVNFPLITGDSIALATSGGTVGPGQGWLYSSAAGGWADYQSLLQGDSLVDDLIYTLTCVQSCPTITATATQVGTVNKATATATGGVAPYTFSWSSTPAQTRDTATGLTYGSTYTVTATDANGCTGTGTVTLGPNGINDIAGLNHFSVYPNPSNGSFTVALSIETASDVTISVVDITGAKVYETTEKSAKDLAKAINLSNIAAGVYVLNVKTATGSTNQLISVK